MSENPAARMYQNYVFTSRHARWDPSKGRREMWSEAVDRYLNFMFAQAEKSGWSPDKAIRQELRDGMMNSKAVGSMRALMTAGPALEYDHAANYNCTAAAVNHPRVFDEACYLLMVGSGFGYSVERQFITNLPVVAEEMHDTDSVLVAADSKIGWATIIRQLISMLYSGEIPKLDLNKIRPAGTPLKKFGGTASGPEPLRKSLHAIIRIFKEATGRKLNSVECSDLISHIAEAVVVGGVRRSATLGLSNLSDDRMRHAKSGDWRSLNPHRQLANLSVAYTEKPDVGQFMQEWKALFDSKSGERGIYNRPAAQKAAEKIGREVTDFMPNPCGEINIPFPVGCCNLSEGIIRPNIQEVELHKRVRAAAILGTIQATFTKFRYLRKIWQNQAEKERLLGVSLTGIMDDPFMSGLKSKKELRAVLNRLRDTVIETNLWVSKKLGIEPSAATTCIKPSGTVSKEMDTAPGIHARFYHKYIGNISGVKDDPIIRFMIDQGIPWEPYEANPENQVVLKFPLTSPKSSRLIHQVSAVDQLELIKLYREEWCHGHNVSCTVQMDKGEWFDAAAWVYNNWDDVCGIAFLPRDLGGYSQPPYQPCEDAQWDDLMKGFPESIDWTKLGEYEDRDRTMGSQQRECNGPTCALNV